MPSHEWWKDLEDDVLRCLEGRGSIEPIEIADKLGMSEAAATSLLALLAREGKVRIRSVEAA